MTTTPHTFTPAEDHCLRLFLEWFSERYGAHLEPPSPEGGALAYEPPIAVCADAASDRRLAVMVRTLYEAGEPWGSLRSSLEAQFGDGGQGGVILWVPPGADLPTGDDATQPFLARVREMAATLGPGDRAFVGFPVTMRLTKMRDEGGLITVEGALSYLWSRMTERVTGTYLLDARPVHRIPPSEQYTEELIDAVAIAAATLSVGQSTEVGCVDAWTVQRLHSGSGLVIVGAPRPPSPEEAGTQARRALRRIVSDASARFAQPRASLHTLLVVGAYVYMEQEGASTAFRGFDPGLYANVEMIALAADGQIRPVLPPRIMPWSGSAL